MIESEGLKGCRIRERFFKERRRVSSAREKESKSYEAKVSRSKRPTWRQ